MRTAITPEQDFKATFLHIKSLWLDHKSLYPWLKEIWVSEIHSFLTRIKIQMTSYKSKINKFIAYIICWQFILHFNNNYFIQIKKVIKYQTVVLVSITHRIAALLTSYICVWNRFMLVLINFSNWILLIWLNFKFISFNIKQNIYI